MTDQPILKPDHVALAFGTPVSTFLWPNSETLNADLHKVLLEKERADQGQSRSNIGGWHSSADLLQWDAPGVAELKPRVHKMTRDILNLTV